MGSRTLGIRFSEAELAQAKAAAAREDLSLNAWILRALKGTAELEAALARLEERRSRPVPVGGSS